MEENSNTDLSRSSEEWEAKLLISSPQSNADASKLLDEFGCVVLKDVLNLEMLDLCSQHAKNLRVQIDEAIANKQCIEDLRHKYTERGSICLNTVQSIIEPITALIRSSIIPVIVEEFFKSKLCISIGISYVRWIDPKTGKLYGPPHQDGGFIKKRSMNICIPVNGYSGEFAGLRVVPGVKGMISEGELVSLLQDDKNRGWTPEFKAGDAMLMNSSIPHWRVMNKNTSQERFNFEIRLRPLEDADVGSNPLMAI